MQSDSCNEYQFIIDNPGMDSSRSLMDGNPVSEAVGAQHSTQQELDALLDVKLKPGEYLISMSYYKRDFQVNDFCACYGQPDFMR